MTRTLLLRSVVLFVTLAGCVGAVAHGLPVEAAATGATEAIAEDDYPPGVSERGIENATALLSAHTTSLAATGFVAFGNGTMTVVRRGLVLDVESDGRTAATANAARYARTRTHEATGITRRTDSWSNGSVAYDRRIQGDQTDYSAGPPEPPRNLTGERLLEPYLHGGDYAVTDLVERGETVRVTVTAAAVANETALMEGLPDAAEEIRSLNATAIIDREGRIRSLTADVGYVIADRNATLHFEYRLTQIDNVTVARPAWVDDADATTETPTVAGPGVRRAIPILDRDAGGATARHA